MDIEMKDIASIGTELVTWVLVIVGWMVVSDQQATRERSKNSTERLDAFRKQLAEVEHLAISFHTRTYKVSDANNLLRKLGRLSREASYLRKQGLIGLGTSEDVRSVRSAITLKNFDRGNHVIQASDSPLVQTIESVCNNLDRQFVEASFQTFNSEKRLRDSLKEIFKKRL